MNEKNTTLIKVATIIVTYNGEECIKKCVSSLVNSETETDIYVVDNGSSDQTLSVFKGKKYAEIISLNQNYGFGYANNIALKEALELNYDYYFLVNQDVYVMPETITQLVEFAEKRKDFGIICPIQYDGKGEKIDFLFSDYLSKSTENEVYYESSFVNAAAWLISKKCLQTVGLFSPLFHHYGEDNNYCHRVLFHNFKIGIVKNTQVLHDRKQNVSFEKAFKLAKIKLLTVFVNPNLTETKSVFEGIKNVFGISKFLFNNYKKIGVFKTFWALLVEYFTLVAKTKELSKIKIQSKNIFLKNEFLFFNKK